MFWLLNIEVFYHDCVEISFACNFRGLLAVKQMNIDKYFLNSEWDNQEVLISIPSIKEYGWWSIKIY